MKNLKKIISVTAAAAMRRAFWQQALQDAEAMHQQMQEAAAVPQHHLPKKAAPHRIPVRKK